MTPAAIEPYFESHWKKYTDRDEFINFMSHIRKRYEQTSLYAELSLDPGFSSPFGKLEGLPHAFGTWMPGVALIGGHLKAKKGVTNLMVAKTMEAFSKALRVIIMQNDRVRFAYIVSPSFSWCPLPVNFPQHKVAVLIEKCDSVVKMAILDSMPIGGQRELSADNLEVCPENLWEGYGTRGKFNGPELICRAFFKAIEGLNLTSEIFHSQVIRQSQGGCAIFALYDAMTYLKDRHFFQVIKTECEKPLPNSHATFQKIIALPSIYMRGTQSHTLLEAYKTDEASLFCQPYFGKTLQDSLKKYSIEIPSDDKPIDQNYFTTRKEIKYYLWMIEIIETNPELANKLIAANLLQ